VLVRTLTFSPDQDEGFFQELPAAPAVFLLRGDGEPYVSKSANLRRRLMRLLGPPLEQSKRLNLRDRVRKVEFTATGSDFESQFLLYQLLRDKFPKTYSNRLRFRFAHLIKLHLENKYPRASVTTRLGSLVSRTESSHASQGLAAAEAATSLTPLTARLEAVPFQSSLRSAEGIVEGAAKPSSLARPDGRGHSFPHGPSNLYYGPFPSRAAAEKFASDALDFFRMRRCVDDLHPDPTFPGCVYSEMKMCLAPCFKGCTDAEYHAEIVRVQTFFDTAGQSLTRELTEQRERASAELAFEDAAAVHAKLDKLKPVLTQLPEIVRRIDRLQAIILQPGAEPGRVVLFKFCGAAFAGPVMFNIELRAESRSMEAEVEEIIRDFPAPPAKSSVERMEHLAILKRWYFRSSRGGEIFFADDRGLLPLRRIVRGIRRVYRGEKELEPESFSATPNQITPS
jgi:excinuclease UvrABC nuclease subunit